MSAPADDPDAVEADNDYVENLRGGGDADGELGQMLGARRDDARGEK